MTIQLEGAKESPLAPGTMVGEYQVTHKLGEGGMGVVYAGMHPEIGKRVAIKVLAAHAAVYPDLIRRFKEEARAVNKIRHPNIIDIFAFNQLPDGRHYFVMEYLDGESLTARLERGPMEPVEMRRLLGQICSALEAAHEAGVVHRDLKPDNVWVATEHLSEPRIKLLDFGIAKLSNLAGAKTTQAGVAMGTPHYMSPEQGMGRAVDHRTDVYALGVILYQIFAGALPFDGVTAQEIIFQHVTEVPAPPSSHRPIAPRALERIILECLEKEPSKRPASMRELGARIEGAFNNVDVSAAVPASPVLTVPASQRTEVLPDTVPRVSAPRATISRSPTTLRGSAGEVTTGPSDQDASDATDLHGRRISWRRIAAIAIGAGAVAATVVGVMSAGGHPSSDIASPPAQAQPASGATAAVPPTEKAALVAVPPEAPPAAPPVAAVPDKAPVATAAVEETAAAETKPASSAPTSVRPERPRKVSHPKKTQVSDPTPSAAPAPSPAKPDCSSKFYFDAQGDKHFKPECF